MFRVWCTVCDFTYLVFFVLLVSLYVYSLWRVYVVYEAHTLYYIKYLPIITPRCCLSVCLSSALWKNGGSDPDAVWHGKSDGSRVEAVSGV